MELVCINSNWTYNIHHTINYDSWEQFLNCNENLKQIWKNMSLMSWACRQENKVYLLQLLFINKEPVLSTLGSVFNRPTDSSSFQLDLRSVEIKFTETVTKDVTQWLIDNNPDMWQITKLHHLIHE